jgi:hypothetical protein
MNGKKSLIGAAIFLIAALLVSSAAAVVSYGNLSVNSTPGNATVTLDGKAAGLTPLLISNLTAARHTVLISKEGYKQVKNTVVIKAGKTQFLNATLVKVNPTKTPTVKPTKTQTVKPTKTVTVKPTKTGTPGNMTTTFPTATPASVNSTIIV